MVHERYIKNREAVIIMSWWDSVAYKYYNREDTSGSLESGEAAEKCYNEVLLTGNEQNFLMENEYVLVLESYYPSRVSQLILGKERLDKKYLQNSLKIKIEKMFDVTCRKMYSGFFDIYIIKNKAGGRKGEGVL
jgi:hypothetical protein